MAKIEEHSIFGNYNTNENRVTDAFLQIVNAGGESFVNYLLQKRDKELPEDNMIVETQYQAGSSDPDGRINCRHSYTLFIESKITNVIDKKQMEHHLKKLQKELGYPKYLIYITNGSTRPTSLKKEILWYSWEEIYMLATEYQTNDNLFHYLVEQFRILLESLDLIDKDWKNRVIVVPGLHGEDEALNYHFYACQPNRSFAPSQYIVFYKKGEINHLFKIVGQPISKIEKKDIPEISNSDYADNTENYDPNQEVEYFRLEYVEKLETIQNDTTNSNGKNVAYVQRQRYTTLDKIKKARLTSEL